MKPAYPPLQLWIGGRWLDAGNRICEPVLNPSTGEILGLLPHATPEDVDAALAAAEAAFQVWRKTAAIERSKVLRRTADLIRAGRKALAELICLELGKPLPEALREADTAAEMFEWSAEECPRAYGRIIPARTSGLRLMVVPEPVGPVAGFSGWNAPSITPSRKISGAVAAGCSIIIKPSERTPATALFLAHCLEGAGLMPGVVNFVFGNPSAVAEQLLRSPIIRMITFTGATSVGKQLAALATQTMKRMVLELGGHAPVLVFPDVDVDKVVQGAAATKFRNSGQVCTSPTRFFIHESIYEHFAKAFAELARNWRVGDPFAESTQMGPVQNARRLEAMEALVEDALAHGARLLAGGYRIGKKGFFFAPTVLADVSPACRAANEEPFGPVALLAPFADEAQAISLANRLPLGLASYLFTRDLGVTERVSSAIDAGNVIVNHWVVSFPETPFGGVKDSGIGREGGIEGLQAFQNLKFISQNNP